MTDTLESQNVCHQSNDGSVYAVSTIGSSILMTMSCGIAVQILLAWVHGLSKQHGPVWESTGHREVTFKGLEGCV
jgi:hypothetical protein